MNNKKSLSFLAILIAIVACSSCTRLNVTSHTRSGAAGSIVVIEGDVSWAQVVWDVGTQQEQILKSGFLGANFFTVPYDAAEGVHRFRIVRHNEQSEILEFNVNEKRPSPIHDIQYASPVWTSFSGDGRITTWLMVQGPNIDAGATVMVDDRRVPTLSYKVLINDIYGVDPSTLGFAKYHYTALLAMIPARNAGSTVQLKVVNLDNVVPGTALFYKLPESSTTLDSDGDNIPDAWEINGYDSDGDGSADLDLRRLGADPYRKDIFLELDIMEGLTYQPELEVFQTVKDAFAAAPWISGRSAANGINLWIDTDGSVPYSDFIYHECCTQPRLGVVDLYDLKATYFDDQKRGRIFQYGVWAHAMLDGSSGVSDADDQATGRYFVVPGDELIVSLDDFPESFQTTRNRASTLMHELGHNLLQSHGGNNMYPYNPAYHSVMSYSWQLRTGMDDDFRRRRRCCAAFYYAQSGALENNGAVFRRDNLIIDYSEGMGRRFSETALDEQKGICDNIPVDWNFNGIIDTEPVEFDVDPTRYRTAGPPVEEISFGDYCNWCMLDFRGPERNGRRN